ncbi:SAM-dependent methyltransferase [bacterium (Candidatus Blackallbacteria) CG17_big_fil_post_rev_8_21_14_2_50_48_46]|uniref:SAM-dependent methyltransferase n=1 Tax=bacterium (Candidatus Blackallbacteria) CG17_big_fil_post_rev_8_21_14_2_50_48_46 TaxID=2014261 RepID=A0A2M7G8C4_9BACT|nr:MAG: SAM-dependent methyltransferase [bacterium (Candidatus Blackallbacteria) CG17_big_fil_post_rev_8_21_14_2_50_48_46]
MQDTNAWYRENANQFIASTYALNMEALYAQFLPLLPVGGLILDYGCGSGRDSLAFAKAGYEVLAIDPCPEFIAYLENQADQNQIKNLEVRLGSLEEVSEKERFDGVWACASLLHLPKHALTQTLIGLAQHLIKGGVLYASFKKGTFEGGRNGRYFTDMEPGKLENLIHTIQDFELKKIWLTEDIRPERVESWVNLLAIKQST